MRLRYILAIFLMCIVTELFCEDAFISKSIPIQSCNISVVLDMDTFCAAILQLLLDKTVNSDDILIKNIIKAYSDKRNYDNRIDVKAINKFGLSYKDFPLLISLISQTKYYTYISQELYKRKTDNLVADKTYNAKLIKLSQTIKAFYEDNKTILDDISENYLNEVILEIEKNKTEYFKVIKSFGKDSSNVHILITPSNNTALFLGMAYIDSDLPLNTKVIMLTQPLRGNLFYIFCHELLHANIPSRNQIDYFKRTYSTLKPNYQYLIKRLANNGAGTTIIDFFDTAYGNFFIEILAYAYADNCADEFNDKMRIQTSDYPPTFTGFDINKKNLLLYYDNVKKFVSMQHLPDEDVLDLLLNKYFDLLLSSGY